jgi:predicted ATPase
MIGSIRHLSVHGSKLVVVEGNIGVGKTTLVDEVAKKMNVKAIFEPIAENPYLKNFYADPKKYALKLQLWIFRRRLQLYTDALDHMERHGISVAVKLDKSETEVSLPSLCYIVSPYIPWPITSLWPAFCLN